MSVEREREEERRKNGSIKFILTISELSCQIENRKNVSFRQLCEYKVKINVKCQGQRSRSKVKGQRSMSRSRVKAKGQGQRSKSRSKVEAMPAKPQDAKFLIKSRNSGISRQCTLPPLLDNVQNVLLSSERLRDIEKAVEKGHFSTKTEKKGGFQTISWLQGQGQRSRSKVKVKVQGQRSKVKGQRNAGFGLLAAPSHKGYHRGNFLFVCCFFLFFFK